jgi:hypothetical protein
MLRYLHVYLITFYVIVKFKKDHVFFINNLQNTLSREYELLVFERKAYLYYHFCPFIASTPFSLFWEVEHKCDIRIDNMKIPLKVNVHRGN